MMGIVYYADDPDRKILRWVWLEAHDTEDVLDDPRWTTEGLDPNRKAVLEKVEAEPPERLHGTPSSPPTRDGTPIAE